MGKTGLIDDTKPGGIQSISVNVNLKQVLVHKGDNVKHTRSYKIIC